MKKTLIIFPFLILLITLGIYGLTSSNNSNGQPQKPEVNNTEDDEGRYVDTEFGYSIKIPEGFRIEKEGEYSKRLIPDKDITGMGPANFIYISLISPGNKDKTGEIYNYDPLHFEKLIALENIGDSVNLAEGDVPELGEWFTYTVVAVEDIDQGKVKNFENTKPWEFPSGTTENRYIYGTAEKVYILGYYTGGNSVSEDLRIDPRVAYEVIKSFRILR
jgi:hypothetical protein